LVSKQRVTNRKRRILVPVGVMEENGKFRVEKFNGPNYQLWKMKMEDYLYHKDIFLPLGGIQKNPRTLKDEK
jgi:hypothetical protein